MAKKSFKKTVSEVFAKAGLVETGKVGGTVSVEVRDADPLEYVAESALEDEDAFPPAPDVPLTAQARTKEDLWREHIGRRITETYVELDGLQDDLADKETTANEARLAVADVKAEISGLNAKLKSYAGQMRDIQNGTFSPPLFDKHTGEVLAPANRAAVGPVAVDPGESAGLEALGLSDSLRTKLAESQLAKEVKLQTVADLERAIAADEWWYRKIKGLGLTHAEKVIDAIVAYRAAHPLPVADDGRVKQCTSADCREDDSHGLFVPGEKPGDLAHCPVCGNAKFWELVDPTEDTGPVDDADDE